jgi:hypothetical protein
MVERPTHDQAMSEIWSIVAQALELHTAPCDIEDCIVSLLTGHRENLGMQTTLALERATQALQDDLAARGFERC